MFPEDLVVPRSLEARSTAKEMFLYTLSELISIMDLQRQTLLTERLVLRFGLTTVRF